MITIIKTVREIYNTLTGKKPEYMEGFYDCLTYFIIGFDKSEQHNLYLIIQELKQENAELRSMVYKLRKHKSIITDETVQEKLTNLQQTVNQQSQKIQRQRVQLMVLTHNTNEGTKKASAVQYVD